MKWKEVILRYRLHHVCFWLLLFAGWHYFRYQDYPARSAWLITTIKVVDLALLVYITNYVLIPKVLYRKKYLVFIVVFLLMIFTSSIIKMYWIGYLLNPAMPLNIFDRFKVRVYDNVFPHILLVSTGAAFKLLLDRAKTERRLSEMAREKAQAELQFLKSQINPHLLFNSLNTIYFLIDKQNPEARKTLLQFSDLLRYQLYDCNADTIEIEKELAYLEDYVKLQQLRKDNRYEVDIASEGKLNGFHITPLLLIPFVENAFKHISHYTDKKNYVHIKLARQNDTLDFSVINSKESMRGNEPGWGGIGLANVKRRLELLYPGRFRLQINDNSDIFSVHLQLDIAH